MHGRATCSTSPRVRGEVDLRAEPLRSEANRVRGRFHSLRLAATPPHPDSFAPLRFARNPTSPRTRGEVAQVACALPKRSAESSRVRGEVDLRAELLRSEANRVRGRFHSLRLAATPPHRDSFASLGIRPLPARGERWKQVALPSPPLRKKIFASLSVCPTSVRPWGKSRRSTWKIRKTSPATSGAPRARRWWTNSPGCASSSMAADGPCAPPFP